VYKAEETLIDDLTAPWLQWRQRVLLAYTIRVRPPSQSEPPCGFSTACRRPLVTCRCAF